MARRLSSPVFVGRTKELDALLSTADSAASGRASITLVGGEAGVGKTRFVGELAARLRERDWLVLEGGSVALGDDSLPFGPIVEALRALVREVDSERIATAAGASLPELARLVPELSGVVGSAADRRAPGGVAPGPHLRRRAPVARPVERGDADPPRRRGPPLGGPVDPGPARVPRPQRPPGAAAGRGHVPDRRAAPASSAHGLAGRGRPAATGRAVRPGTVPARRPRRAARPADRGRQRAVRADPDRFGRPAVRRQRLLRRGACGQHRRDRWLGRPAARDAPGRAPGPARQPLGRRRPSRGDRRRRRARGRPRRAGRRVRAGRACPRRGAARSGRRPAPARRPGCVRRPLPLPPRARPGGRVRPAAAVGTPPPP